MSGRIRPSSGNGRDPDHAALPQGRSTYGARRDRQRPGGAVVTQEDGSPSAAVQDAKASVLRVEDNGINVVADEERTIRPHQLFWPWFGANVSVLALSYGAFAFGFGISFAQAVVAGLLGIVLSFLARCWTSTRRGWRCSRSACACPATSPR